MMRKLLAGVCFATLMGGAALAQAGGDGKEGAVAATAQEGNAVSAQPPADPKCAEPAKEPPTEYSVGVSGFLRGEGTGNFRLADFSYQPNYSQARLLYRVRPFATWNPTDYLGLRLEGQGYGFAGRGDDVNLYLYQGYLDAKLPGRDWLAVRLGRQEFSYGSAFILGPDAFFDGLSFDAARFRLQPFDALSIDVLGGFYAAPSANGVKGNLSGLYATWTASEGNGVELYALRDTGSTFRHAGEEQVSWGVRGTAKTGPISLEVEPVYQSGEVYDAAQGGNDTITAFGAHADLAADLTLAGLHHRFSAGYAYGSGSQAAADGGSTRREFHNPNNDTCLLGDISVFADLSGVTADGNHASGLNIYSLGWGVDLTKELAFSANGRYFRANYVQTGLSRELGLETDFNVTYSFTDNLSLTLAYDRFFTGSFFHQTTGSRDDIHYGYAMLNFKLEKAKLKPQKTARD
jgi:hypothetical protein